MSLSFFSFFFFNDTATTEIYTLSLHDALPICLAHPGKLAPYEFFADIASDDPRDLPRRGGNLLYSLLYLGPILIAGILRLKTWRSEPAGVNDSGRGPREPRPSRTHPTQPTLRGLWCPCVGTCG